MLTACDTIRSGAVEHVRVHANRLDAPLHHQGNAKDSSQVAYASIAHAVEIGNDVVLIETAGRMPNDVPDLVFLVCEALVVTDGIDHLNTLEEALQG